MKYMFFIIFAVVSLSANSQNQNASKDAFGNIQQNNSTYVTKDAFGNIQQSSACYKTKDAYGNLQQSAGCK
jgi:ABC-type tungstate transport system permease subunit